MKDLSIGSTAGVASISGAGDRDGEVVSTRPSFSTKYLRRAALIASTLTNLSEWDSMKKKKKSEEVKMVKKKKRCGTIVSMAAAMAVPPTMTGAKSYEIDGSSKLSCT